MVAVRIDNGELLGERRPVALEPGIERGMIYPFQTAPENQTSPPLGVGARNDEHGYRNSDYGL